MITTANRFLNGRSFLLAGLTVMAALLSTSPSEAATGDLFVLTSAGGSVERVPGTREYKLVLRRPAGDVTVFSDRPARRAGEQPLAGFVRSWRRLGFASVPPNAALVIDDAPAGRDVAVFELSSPRLGQRTLTFRAKALSRRPSGALRRLGRRADDPAAGRFGRASLFVDPAGDTRLLSCAFAFTDLPHGAGRGASFGFTVSMGSIDVNTDGAANVASFKTAFAVTNISTSLLGATVQVSLAVPVDTKTLQGTGTGSGGAATVKCGNGDAQPLPTGPFSIPIS